MNQIDRRAAWRAALGIGAGAAVGATVTPAPAAASENLDKLDRQVARLVKRTTATRAELEDLAMTAGQEAAAALAEKVAGTYISDADATSRFAPAGAVTVAPEVLPGLCRHVVGFNEATPTPARVFGFGSSVGNGPTLPEPENQAPSNRLVVQLKRALDPRGVVPIELTNASVNGSVIASAVQGKTYDATKSKAGGPPTVVLYAFGMNDGMPAQYHSGQTYSGVLTFGRQLLGQAKADGADLIVCTSPHPHTARVPSWTSPSVTYPAPDVLLPSEADSVVTVELADGRKARASTRHLRVNQALRQLARETGAVLVDVERYWLDAVAARGEDALYNAQEYAHPNLLGHQLSYWAAIDDLIGQLI